MRPVIQRQPSSRRSAERAQCDLVNPAHGGDPPTLKHEPAGMGGQLWRADRSFGIQDSGLDPGRQRFAVTTGQDLDHVGTDVVARARILLTRVAEPDDQPVGRGSGPSRRRASPPQHRLLPAALVAARGLGGFALDGFAPSSAQLERKTTQVWSAESGHGKSLNHDRMLTRIEEYNKKAKNKQKVNMFPASSDCTTKYALHFSLVNLSANDSIVKLIADGYKSCTANFPWLP